MRTVLLLLPALLLGQTPAKKSTVPPKPAAASPKPAAPKPTKVKPVAPAAKALPKPKPTAAAPVTDEEKTIYALGLTIHRSLGQFDLSPAEFEILKQALTDASTGKPKIEIHQWGPKIQDLARSRASRGSDREKVVSTAYLTKAAAEPGAEKTATGIVYIEMTPGAGASPKASDTVKVHYRGTLVNGTEFDSSYARNDPAQFQLTGVIKCWTEGLQKMKVGGKSRLVCPSDMAYGDQGRPGIPGGAALIFEVELLDIIAQ